MTDELENHEGTVSIGGRKITDLRFADDIDGLARKEEELENFGKQWKQHQQHMAWRSAQKKNKDHVKQS